MDIDTFDSSKHHTALSFANLAGAVSPSPSLDTFSFEFDPALHRCTPATCTSGKPSKIHYNGDVTLNGGNTPFSDSNFNTLAQSLFGNVPPLLQTLPFVNSTTPSSLSADPFSSPDANGIRLQELVPPNHPAATVAAAERRRLLATTSLQ